MAGFRDGFPANQGRCAATGSQILRWVAASLRSVHDRFDRSGRRGPAAAGSCVPWPEGRPWRDGARDSTVFDPEAPFGSEPQGRRQIRRACPELVEGELVEVRLGHVVRMPRAFSTIYYIYALFLQFR